MFGRDELRERTIVAQDKDTRARQNKQKREAEELQALAQDFVQRVKRTLARDMRKAADSGKSSLRIVHYHPDSRFVRAVMSAMSDYCKRKGLKMKVDEEKPFGSDPMFPYTVYGLDITWRD